MIIRLRPMGSGVQRHCRPTASSAHAFGECGVWPDLAAHENLVHEVRISERRNVSNGCCVDFDWGVRACSWAQLGRSRSACMCGVAHSTLSQLDHKQSLSDI